MSLREAAPDLWANILRICREQVGDWTEDEIAAVIGKIRTPNREDMPDAIGYVMMWCSEAQNILDSEESATVDLWKMPFLPIEILVEPDGDGFFSVSHRINPDVNVRIEK